MAEKKDETKTARSYLYTVDEYAENPYSVRVSQDIIRTAFARAKLKKQRRAQQRNQIHLRRRRYKNLSGFIF